MGLVSAILDVIEIKLPELKLPVPIIALSDMQGFVQQGSEFIPLGEDVFTTLLPIVELDGIIHQLSDFISLILGVIFTSAISFRMGLSGNIDCMIHDYSISANMDLFLN